MQESEEALYQKCAEIERAAKRAEGAAWLDVYIDQLHVQLAEHLSTMQAGALNISVSTLHAQRREIAVLHQEIELRGQGQRVYDQAVADRSLVVFGCRYV